MTFYHQCLGAELTLTRLCDTPMKNMIPKDKHDQMINGHLVSGDFEISATDWMASPTYDPIQGNTYAIFVIGSTSEELKSIFDKLAQGAEKDRFQELHNMPFGMYGQFYDKYGVRWIFRGDRKE